MQTVKKKQKKTSAVKKTWHKREAQHVCCSKSKPDKQSIAPIAYTTGGIRPRSGQSELWSRNHTLRIKVDGVATHYLFAFGPLLCH